MIKELDSFGIKAYDGKVFSTTSTDIIKEVSVEIHLNDEKITAIACTGNHLQELAVGFLKSEGVLRTLHDLEKVVARKEWNVVQVYADMPPRFSISEFNLKKAIASSGARYRIPDENDLHKKTPSYKTCSVAPEKALNLMKKLLESSYLHERTHGTHCSALADGEGIIVSREDIGRHNTIDMLCGYAFLSSMDCSDKIILTTGRISSEIVLKIWNMGIPIIISHSAPTSKAVSLVEEAGITLIGYVRGEKMNIYSHAERVTT